MNYNNINYGVYESQRGCGQLAGYGFTVLRPNNNNINNNDNIINWLSVRIGRRKKKKKQFYRDREF